MGEWPGRWLGSWHVHFFENIPLIIGRDLFLQQIGQIIALAPEQIDHGIRQFHLARGNALTRHLAGSDALIVINGPDAYVSPRWYGNRDTVPTWDYIALELEGRVRRMADEGLEAFLHAAIAKHEVRLAGEPWRAEESSEKVWGGLFRGIAGFELEVLAWRPTLKLSHNKPAEDRARIADGLEAAGKPALAHLIRGLAA